MNKLSGYLGLLVFFLLGFAEVFAQSPPEFLTRAQSDLQKGNIQQAIQTLQKGLEEHPDLKEGWVLLGQNYLALRQGKKAEEALTRALALGPTALIHLLLAQSHHIRANYPKAIQEYQSVLELSPDGPEAESARRGLSQIGHTPEEAQQAKAHFERAVDYQQQGDMASALQEIGALLNILPEHLAGLSLKASLLAQQGKLDDAIAPLEKAVRIDETFLLGHSQLAALYHAMGNIEQAILASQKVIELNPNSPQAAEAKKRLRQTGETPEDANKALDLISQAKGFAEGGFLVRTYTLMKDVMKLIPDSPTANFFMGEVQSDLGLLDEAVQSYQKVIEIEPLSHSAFFKLGFVYQLKGMFKEAAVAYQTAITLGKDAPVVREAQRRLMELGGSPQVTAELETLFEKGRKAVQAEDYEAAAEAYRKATELVPVNTDAHYQMGLVLRKAGKNHEAITALKNALELNPQLFQAHYILGIIYEEEGMIDEAIFEYKQAAGFGKGIPEGEDARERAKLLEEAQAGVVEANVHFERANALKKENDLAGAIQEYQEAIAVKPDVATFHLNLARVYLLTGQTEEAFRSLLKVLALEPDMVQALFTLGVIYEKRALYFEAIEAFQKVLQTGTDEIEVSQARKEQEETIKKYLARERGFNLVREGNQHIKEGNIEKAIATFETAVNSDPMNFQIQYQLAELYQQQFQIEKATSAFKKALEIRPWDMRPRRNLAKLYEQQQMYDQALIEYQIIDQLEKAVRASDDVKALETGDPQIQSLLERRRKTLEDSNRFFEQAKEHVQKKEFPLAETKIKYAIFLDPSNHVYHSNLGFILYSQNKKTQSRHIYRRTLSINPTYAPAHLSLGVIFEEGKFYHIALESYEYAIEYGLEGAELERAKKNLQSLMAIVQRINEAQEFRTKGFELANQGKDDEALEAYLKANEIEPEATTYFNMGLVYKRKEAFEKAEQAMLKAIELDEENAGFHVQLADLYFENDKISEAEKRYALVVEVGDDPENPDVRYAQGRLDTLRKKLSYTVNHVFLEYDSNRLSSSVNVVPGVATRFGLTLSYSLKRTRKLSIPISFSISNYFDLRFQFFSNSETLSSRIQYVLLDNYSVLLGYNFGYNMTDNGPSANTHTFSLSGSRRGKWPTNASLGYNGVRNVSFRTALNDFFQHTVQLNLSQNLTDNLGTVGFNYGLVKRDTVRPDQENIGHNFSLSYSNAVFPSIIPNLTGNIGYGFSLIDFQNPDLLGRRRQILINSINSGLSYLVSSDFSLRTDYSYQSANTNLRASPEDLDDLLADQVLPLEDYSKHVISFRATLSF